MLSVTYIIMAREICFTLPTQETRFAFSFALASAGRSILARMAMIAITTSSSMRVKPHRREGRDGREIGRQELRAGSQVVLIKAK